MESVSKRFIISYGIGIAIFMVLYYHLMQALGLGHIVSLRITNTFFLVGGIYIALRQQRNNNQAFNYLEGLITGFLIGIVNAILFAAYVSLHLIVFDPEFLDEIQSLEGQGRYINAVTVPTVLLIELTALGFLSSFASMQFLKKKVTVSSQTG